MEVSLKAKACKVTTKGGEIHALQPDLLRAAVPQRTPLPKKSSQNGNGVMLLCAYYYYYYYYYYLAWLILQYIQHFSVSNVLDMC